MNGINALPHPRGHGVRALLTRLRIEWAGRMRQTFEDRAVKGLNDGYSVEQLTRLSALLLRGGRNEDGERKLESTDEIRLLRTRLDLLLLHSMMLRGESTRGVELPDLASYVLPNEGSDCLAVVLRVDSGKSIKLSDAGDARKTHYHGALRSRDPLLCPLGALAQWLVLRWDLVATEKPPNFADRSSWYTTKLLPARFSLPEKELSDATQRAWIAPTLQAVDVDTSAAVHTMRRSSSRLADMWEVPADQVHPPPLPSPPPRLLLIAPTDIESRRVGAGRLGHQLPLPPPSGLYEGCCRVWDRPRQLSSEEGNTAAFGGALEDAVALG